MKNSGSVHYEEHILQTFWYRLALFYVEIKYFFANKSLTNKSLLPTRMYLSIKSRIVSQQAVKVGEVRRSFRCCKNTLESKEAARILVSSIEFGS